MVLPHFPGHFSITASFLHQFLPAFSALKYTCHVAGNLITLCAVVKSIGSFSKSWCIKKMIYVIMHTHQVLVSPPISVWFPRIVLDILFFPGTPCCSLHRPNTPSVHVLVSPTPFSYLGIFILFRFSFLCVFLLKHYLIV